MVLKRIAALQILKECGDDLRAEQIDEKFGMDIQCVRDLQYFDEHVFRQKVIAVFGRRPRLGDYQYDRSYVN